MRSQTKLAPTLMENIWLLIFQILLGEQEVGVQIEVPTATGLEFGRALMECQLLHNRV